MADEDEAEELETPVLRPLVWLGNSRRNLRAFPDEAKKIIGDELQLIQFGGMPKDAKPFKGVGSGVFEIALRHDARRIPHGGGRAARQEHLRSACLSEEVEERHRHAETGCGSDQTAIQRGEGAGRT